jgi:hypothetical protein
MGRQKLLLHTPLNGIGTMPYQLQAVKVVLGIWLLEDGTQERRYIGVQVHRSTVRRRAVKQMGRLTDI